jgi:hypothetical protein
MLTLFVSGASESDATTWDRDAIPWESKLP